MKFVVLVGLLVALTGVFYQNLSHSSAMRGANQSVQQLGSFYANLETVYGSEHVDEQSARLTASASNTISSLLKLGTLSESLFLALMCTLPVWGVLQISRRMANQLA